jgi:hypothetical protein
VPEYVCRGNGFQGNALNNDIETQVGEILFFPVNDPQQQVQSGGTLCRPDGVDGPCTVQKYAMVGFAALEVTHVWTGQDAQAMCDQLSANNGSLAASGRGRASSRAVSRRTRTSRTWGCSPSR